MAGDFPAETNLTCWSLPAAFVPEGLHCGPAASLLRGVRDLEVPQHQAGRAGVVVSGVAALAPGSHPVL